MSRLFLLEGLAFSIAVSKATRLYTLIDFAVTQYSHNLKILNKRKKQPLFLKILDALE